MCLHQFRCHWTLPVTLNLNASAYQDILDNAMLLTFWEGPWLDESGVEDPDRALTSTTLNPFEMNWNRDCKQDFSSSISAWTHQWSTGWMKNNSSQTLQNQLHIHFYVFTVKVPVRTKQKLNFKIYNTFSHSKHKSLCMHKYLLL